MSEYIDAVKATRKLTSDVLAKVLTNVEGQSEIAIRDALLGEFSKSDQVHSTGWYDPPAGGVAVLFDASPYTRLQFETLRDAKSWPSDSVFEAESVGMVYCSPVDKQTNMFGDIGLGLYTGDDHVVQNHLRASRDSVVAAAELAEVGMQFKELYASAIQMFADQAGKVIGWMTTNHDPLKINLGHTVPGTYEPVDFGMSFGEIRETIRTKRIYINEIETFTIPPTCAFTLEARLTDSEKKLPNVFFHVIVTFDSGKKEILTDFDAIYQSVGMDYML